MIRILELIPFQKHLKELIKENELIDIKINSLSKTSIEINYIGKTSIEIICRARSTIMAYELNIEILDTVLSRHNVQLKDVLTPIE